MPRIARLVVVFVAALGWSAVGLLFADWAGLLAPAPEVSVAAIVVGADPCALRQPLPAGTDARCEFPIARRGATPLLVELAQTWESVTPQALVQHLRVREPGAPVTLFDLESRTGLTPVPRRLLRLGVVRAAEGEEHLLYVVGTCGNPACGQNDLVVVTWDGTTARELLRRRIGAQAEVEVGDGRVTAFDGTGTVVGGRLDRRMKRSYVWIDGLYVQTVFDPVPTPTPPGH